MPPHHFTFCNYSIYFQTSRDTIWYLSHGFDYRPSVSMQSKHYVESSPLLLGFEIPSLLFIYISSSVISLDLIRQITERDNDFYLDSPLQCISGEMRVWCAVSGQFGTSCQCWVCGGFLPPQRTAVLGWWVLKRENSEEVKVMAWKSYAGTYLFLPSSG